jgi:hypothetical protein
VAGFYVEPLKNLTALDVLRSLVEEFFVHKFEAHSRTRGQVFEVFLDLDFTDGLYALCVVQFQTDFAILSFGFHSLLTCFLC